MNIFFKVYYLFHFYFTKTKNITITKISKKFTIKLSSILGYVQCYQLAHILEIAFKDEDKFADLILDKNYIFGNISKMLPHLKKCKKLVYLL